MKFGGYGGRGYLSNLQGFRGSILYIQKSDFSLVTTFFSDFPTKTAFDSLLLSVVDEYVAFQSST